MVLIYRGRLAQPSATAKTVETGINGKFLGRQFPIRQGQMTRKLAEPLQYRGILY